MSESPGGHIPGTRDQRAPAPAEPVVLPANAAVDTHTSTVVNESPNFVTETRQSRVESGVPTGAPMPPGGSSLATRTTMFSGDPAYRGVQVVWLLLGVTELIIGLRVLFRAMDAADTGFVSLMYGIGGAFAAPFRGISNYTSGSNVVEVGSIIAMVVYLLVAYLVIRGVRIAAAPHRPRA